jgi:hypothetical protein
MTAIGPNTLQGRRLHCAFIGGLVAAVKINCEFLTADSIQHWRIVGGCRHDRQSKHNAGEYNPDRTDHFAPPFAAVLVGECKAL